MNLFRKCIRFESKRFVLLFLVTMLVLLNPVDLLASRSTTSSGAPAHRNEAQAFQIKSTTDPTFECSGCARTRLIGCFHGQCSYRCYRSCTNGNEVIIEAHRFVLEGQRKRRKRYID